MNVKKVYVVSNSRRWAQTIPFFWNTKKWLVGARFLPVLDYGVITYIYSLAHCLQSINAVCHAALRFITNCKFLIHHFEINTQVGLPAVASQRNIH